LRQASLPNEATGEYTMVMLDVLTITRDDFAVAAYCEAGIITASLRGNADHADVELVRLLLERIHADARILSVTAAVIDLRQLELMSTTCVGPFIAWIAAIRHLREEDRYAVRFLSTASFQWQRRCLQSLQTFATDLICVVEDR